MPRIFLAAFLFLGFAAHAAVHVVVTVDWEGRELSTQSLNSMQAFRTDFPDIAILHFLNAAYYTKEEANAEEVTKQIRSVLRDGDEHGLHIHGWKSLFEAAGVEYKDQPSYRGRTSPVLFGDCGHDVRIDGYTSDELRAVIRFSSQKLVSQGFNEPKSFRAGGWLAGDSVIQALIAEGFKLDGSALPPHFLDTSTASHLQEWVTRLWVSIEDITQPYDLELGDEKIRELPNNGALADYVTSEQMLQAFIENAALLKSAPNRDVYLTIGFHQETAATYLPRFRKGIELIKEYASANKIPMVFATFPLFKN